MNMILEVAKTNGYLNDILKYIKDENNDILEWDNNSNKWLYLRRDNSGRDFFHYVPIEFITDEEYTKLTELLIEDFDVDMYDWDTNYIQENNLSIDDIKENLYDELMEKILEELEKGL